MTSPLLIGSRNCEPVLGCSWRWLKDHAAVLELQILTVGGKRFVEAATALDAIKRHAQVRTPERVEVDELAAMRARLGKRRRVA